MGRTPIEWIDQTEDGMHYLGDTYHCTEYREDEGDGDEEPDAPPPPPSYDREMPGQTTIFDALTDEAVAELAREAVLARD